MQAEAADAVERHRQIDAVEQQLTELLADHSSGFVPTDELNKALGLSKAQQAKVNSTMTKLGWHLVGNAVEIRLPDNQRWRRRGWHKGPDYRDRILLLNAQGDALTAWSEDQIRSQI